MSVPFDPQPVLTGELLVLRPLRADDFDALYAVARDPLIWAQHPAHDRHEATVFRAFFDAGLASGGALVAIDRRDGRIVGSSRFHDHDAERREVEIGWTFLARSHWGGAYNREMKHLMLRHAFGAVDRVLFVVGAQNLRSRRAVEKLGGVLTSRPGPRDSGSVVYELTPATLAAAGGVPDAHRALIDRYLAAYNAFDVPGMLALLDPDVHFENVAGGQVTDSARGLDAFRALAERGAALFASRRQTVRRYVATADGARVEIDYEGVLAADLGGELRAGSTLRLAGVSTFGIRDGRIARLVDES